MGAITYIRKKNRRICLGDMDIKISIYTRNIVAPTVDVDFDEVFANRRDVWAMVETKRGKEIFDGVNLKGIATHFMYINFFPGLTSESWVVLRGNFYKILSIENLDEDNYYYLLSCSITGEIQSPSTEAR